VLVVSDHGAKKMEGGICLNEWLIKEGYLTLKAQPAEVVPLKNENIDWDKTKAWGSGGYYGRLFLNVEGREPSGIIPADQYEEVRSELVQKLEALGDENGRNIGTRALKPEDVYPVVNGIAPDLILYFGDLFWRSVGSVGLNTIHTFENDTGPDDANHAEHGIFVLSGTEKNPEKLHNLHVMDVAPTVLKLMGEEIPADMEGKSII
jgi:predicted AlkP superfamily phosphohydrolase/phosphomutase